MVEVHEDLDLQASLAKTNLLDNQNMGDLGVLQSKPTTEIKGKSRHIYNCLFSAH